MLQGTISVRIAASQFNIPKSTLQDNISQARQKGINNIDHSGNESETNHDDEKSKYATRQVFSTKEDTELEEYMKNSSKMFYGLTYKTARILAYEFASGLDKKYPKTWDESKMAGVEWMRSFMSRHPRLSYRKPENTSFARASCFNKSNVDLFFKNYLEIQTKYHFPPHKIWNTDETGVTTVLQAPKVIVAFTFQMLRIFQLFPEKMWQANYQNPQICQEHPGQQEF